MTKQAVHLVISRFDEDVAWLHGVVATLAGLERAVTVFVYDKGTTNIDDTIRAALESLPDVTVRHARLVNVGRESHTYLEHVLQMRSTAQLSQDPSCVTVFMQGRMEDHVPPSHASLSCFVASMVQEASQSVLGESSNHGCHTQYGSFNAGPNLRVAMYPGVGDSGLNLGRWFSTFVEPWRWSSVESGPTWWQHGVFAIRTSRMLVSCGKTDDAYYRSLRAQVDWHVNPEAGHFFERSWYFVFPTLLPDHSENTADEATGYVTVGEYAGKVDPAAPRTEVIAP